MAQICFYEPCAGRNKNFRENWKAKTGQGVYYCWRAPKTTDKSEWLQNLPEDHRSTFDFENNKHVLCILHFEERFVLKASTHVVNGESYSFPFARWRLTQNAIPTVFKGTNLSSQMPGIDKKSKDKKILRVERKINAPKRRRISTDAEEEEVTAVGAGPVFPENLGERVDATVTLSRTGNEDTSDRLSTTETCPYTPVTPETNPEVTVVDPDIRVTTPESGISIVVDDNQSPNLSTSPIVLNNDGPATTIVSDSEPKVVQTKSKTKSLPVTIIVPKNIDMTKARRVLLRRHRHEIIIPIRSTRNEEEKDNQAPPILSTTNPRKQNLTRINSGQNINTITVEIPGKKTSSTPKEMEAVTVGESQTVTAVPMNNQSKSKQSVRFVAITPKPFLVVPGQTIPDPRIKSFCSLSDPKRFKIMTSEPRQIKIAPKPSSPQVADVDSCSTSLKHLPGRSIQKQATPQPPRIVKILPKPVTLAKPVIILLGNPRLQQPTASPRLPEPPTVHKPRMLTRAKTRLLSGSQRDPIAIDIDDRPAVFSTAAAPRKQNLTENNKRKNTDSENETETDRNVTAENLVSIISRLSMPSEDWSVNSYPIPGKTEQIFTISETVLTRRNVEIIRKSVTVQKNRPMTFTIFSREIHKLNYLGLHDGNSTVQQALNNFHAYNICEGIRRRRSQMMTIRPSLITECPDHYIHSNWCTFLLSRGRPKSNKSKSLEQVNRCDKCEEIVQCLTLLDSGTVLPSKYKHFVELKSIELLNVTS